jgi:hypothetical protein
LRRDVGAASHCDSCLALGLSRLPSAVRRARRAHPWALARTRGKELAQEPEAVQGGTHAFAADALPQQRVRLVDHLDVRLLADGRVAVIKPARAVDKAVRIRRTLGRIRPLHRPASGIGGSDDLITDVVPSAARASPYNAPSTMAELISATSTQSLLDTLAADFRG